MGGSKTSRTKRVIGNKSKSIKERKDLTNSIVEKNPEKVAEDTLNVFSKSEHVINNLSSLADMYDFFEEYEETSVPDEDLKEKLTDYWVDKKKEKKLSTDNEIDRIVIESATKTLKGGRKK